ncbi:MAG: RdgB/HAM1 family non-canonical purine NTP pyrophosphatase [Verrucomicrobiaceae bacterium]|nr:RdgB/HAM1 family non-canonical purine NTP pyrophosphatase [Verrucomicrobiaceae bacterium]
MLRTLLIATHNAHKTSEMRAILGSHFDRITDLSESPGTTPPVEDGATFAANSTIKALAASRAYPEVFILADDSGLEVDALGGAPGIYSSRYSGEDATDASNRDKLLRELARPEHAGAPRTARFRCVVTLAKGGEVIAQFDGTVEGWIARAMTGEGGFGYDPLFIPEGHNQSFGELSESQKNTISHRSRALQQFQEWLHRSSRD